MDECPQWPGQLCCSTAVAALAMANYACVDVPAGCDSCACMPRDVCGGPEETLKVCAAVAGGVVSCGLPP